MNRTIPHTPPKTKFFRFLIQDHTGYTHPISAVAAIKNIASVAII
jgi:hypothetical protein